MKGIFIIMQRNLVYSQNQNAYVEYIYAYIAIDDIQWIFAK